METLPSSAKHLIYTQLEDDQQALFIIIKMAKMPHYHK